MSQSDQYYNLIGALHDQLEDIETYERYLKDATGDAAASRVWTALKERAEEAVELIRGEIRARAESGGAGMPST